jgi:peroxiredoxin (alkyl hydroperoxide reductase subunit C)
MEETKVNMPLLGDALPELKVQSTHGPMNIPGDMKGKWFVLFSHPADFTPVCTTEFVAFQKRYDEFEKLDCKLIGMSIDQVFSHINGYSGSRLSSTWRSNFLLLQPMIQLL